MEVSIKFGVSEYIYFSKGAIIKNPFGLVNYMDGNSGVSEQKRKVVFNNKGGYPMEQQVAIKDGLIEGEVYDLEEVYVGNYSSKLKIKGFTNLYNTCMFNEYIDHFEVDNVIIDGKYKITYFKDTSFYCTEEK